SEEQSTGMDITSMCNINMMFFLIAIFVCLFVGDDFRSGYAKNLFTVRSKKSDYVISKSVICFIAGAIMIIAFFIGSMIGGAIAGLSFTLEGATPFNVVMCLLAKIFLVGVFSSIYVLASVISKQKLWLSLIVSFALGMLLFMMISIITPLNSTIVHALLCLVGAIIFGFGIGYGSKVILEKTSLV
ncbi:MAG: ABC transporter permease, partial [Bacilli bacterium]